MSFGGGFAAGMGAGFGAGLASGMSGGQRRAVQKLQEMMQERGYTVHDKGGKPVPLHQVLEEISERGCGCSSRDRGKAWYLVAGVLLAAAAAAALVYLLQ